MAEAMEFGFLLDPQRRLLSIGYRAADGTLDPSCYDLLASEARLASFVAIAKGDVPSRHWFRLGRPVTPIGNGAALISWSGSMFEYLMPSLVMRAPAGSLLEQTSRLIVQRQMSYGAALGLPWGISESAYNARDLELTYQYSNFGVPGLGLKRGLSADAVVAPYATALAAMVEPERATRNFARLAALGALGRYGFYEALDYTRSRLPEGTTFAIVRAFMAHHQGMTIVAIANVLLHGIMRRRFHAEPKVQATELLLQERTPRDVSVAHPRAEEVRTAPRLDDVDLPDVRRLRTANDATPQAHLLSNGRYAVMVTAAGSGYSRWRDLGVTRWREDVTRDDTGSYIFLRDVESGRGLVRRLPALRRGARHATRSPSPRIAPSSCARTRASRRLSKSSSRRRTTPRCATSRSRIPAAARATSRSRPMPSSCSRRPRRTRHTRPSRSSSCRRSMSPGTAPSWRRAAGARPASRRSGRHIRRSSRARWWERPRSKPTGRASSAAAMKCAHPSP